MTATHPAEHPSAHRAAHRARVLPRSCRRVLVALTAVAALAGCSNYNDERGKGDAPVGDIDEQPRNVWNNVNGFPNIAAFCIGDNGVYTTTREAAPTVIVDDPECAEGGALR